MTSSTRTNNHTFEAAHGNVSISPHAVKRIVGEALNSVDGILDAEDSLVDFFKGEDDPTRGIKVDFGHGNDIAVHAKVVVEADRNVPEIISKASDKITESVQRIAGLRVTSVDIDVADIVSRQHYKEIFDNAGHSPVCPTK